MMLDRLLVAVACTVTVVCLTTLVLAVMWR